MALRGTIIAIIILITVGTGVGITWAFWPNTDTTKITLADNVAWTECFPDGKQYSMQLGGGSDTVITQDCRKRTYTDWIFSRCNFEDAQIQEGVRVVVDKGLGKLPPSRTTIRVPCGGASFLSFVTYGKKNSIIFEKTRNTSLVDEDVQNIPHEKNYEKLFDFNSHAKSYTPRWDTTRKSRKLDSSSANHVAIYRFKANEDIVSFFNRDTQDMYRPDLYVRAAMTYVQPFPLDTYSKLVSNEFSSRYSTGLILPPLRIMNPQTNHSRTNQPEMFATSGVIWPTVDIAEDFKNNVYHSRAFQAVDRVRLEIVPGTTIRFVIAMSLPATPWQATWNVVLGDTLAQDAERAPSWEELGRHIDTTAREVNRVLLHHNVNDVVLYLQVLHYDSFTHHAQALLQSFYSSSLHFGSLRNIDQRILGQYSGAWDARVYCFQSEGGQTGLDFDARLIQCFQKSTLRIGEENLPNVPEPETGARSVIVRLKQKVSWKRNGRFLFVGIFTPFTARVVVHFGTKPKGIREIVTKAPHRIEDLLATLKQASPAYAALDDAKDVWLTFFEEEP